MGELKRKLVRALNLLWLIPLLVVLVAAGLLLSVTVEKRLLKRDADPGETDGVPGK